jgi:hypothetical protein
MKITVTGYSYGFCINVPGRNPGDLIAVREMSPGDVVYIRDQYGFRGGTHDQNKRIVRVTGVTGPKCTGNETIVGWHTFEGEIIRTAEDISSAYWERHRQLQDEIDRLD